MKIVDLKDEYREETEEDVYAQLPDMGSYSDQYVKWLERKLVNKTNGIHNVVSSLPSECLEDWESNYYCTLSGKCQKCEK